MSSEVTDFKHLVLARYGAQFQPADEQMATIRKTSEDIMLDLRPMAELSTNEIAEYMATNGYTIGFEDATPVWLMRKYERKELTE